MRAILLAAIMAVAAFSAEAKPHLKPFHAKKDKPADTVFLHGYVYTVDAHDSIDQAVAVRDGRIIFVGKDETAKAFIGPKTRVVQLNGRMLMPGLVDGHMHPQSGGLRLVSCSLDYASLTVEQMQARIQACVDKEPDAGPDAWLKVINWFEPGMQPAGTVLTRAALDGVKTTRPIVVHSTYGHTNLVNTRGLQLAGITRDTPDPADGVIVRDAQGEPTGLLQEGAQDLVDKVVPEPSEETNLEATQTALALMAKQGITTFLDAYTDIPTLTAYRKVAKDGDLTARAHFAVLIDSPKDSDAAIAEVLREKEQFEQKDDGAKPVMRVHTAKLFLDGVINQPSFTGMMLSPYFVNVGTAEAPLYRPGTNTGPEPYFPPDALAGILTRLAAAGIDPHMHADGDAAVREALDAVAAMRQAQPNTNVRPAIAHDEIVDPEDYARFGELGALPVLSFQWEKPAVDMAPMKDYLGPARYALVEPAGMLDIHGAKIVFGSDWPVDPLNEWLAIQTALTRSATGEDALKYPERLGVDPGLSLKTALRAITLNAAYSLHQEDVTGSVEVGKYADLIVLDQNLVTAKPERIGDTHVLMTMVGGKVVFEANGL